MSSPRADPVRSIVDVVTSGAVTPSVHDYRDVLGRVYAGDASYVHPDIGFLSRVLPGRSSFLHHASARAFCVPGEAFAVAFVDPRVQERHGAAIGSIGFFEKAVATWARLRAPLSSCPCHRATSPAPSCR